METSIFGGLFGVFNDSLPDGWGRLLMDRFFSTQNIPTYQVNLLDRLSLIGENGRGALVYKPSLNRELANSEMDLDYIYNESMNVYEGEDSDILDHLYAIGGSSAGARPKINVGYNKTTGQICSTQNILPKGYEHWLIKFPNSQDYTDISNIEYAYYKMAIDTGLNMSDSKLFTGKSGSQQYFGTKRFDRNNNRRRHMHTAAGLLHDNFRLSSMDYGHLMDTAFRLENDFRAYERILKVAAFNIFAHNRDDHSNNFSFLMRDNGSWSFSPVYDLTFSSSSHGQHSTTVAGEGASPGTKDLHKLAKTFDIKKINEIIEEVKSVLTNWNTYANEAGVKAHSKNMINTEIQQLISN